MSLLTPHVKREVEELEATKEIPFDSWVKSTMGNDLKKDIQCLQHKFKCCELLGPGIDISSSICKDRCAVMGEVATEQYPQTSGKHMNRYAM